jgi:hypothetical protein
MQSRGLIAVLATRNSAASTSLSLGVVSHVATWKKSLNPQQPHLESIQADIEELGRQGQWFKVIKRLAALARAQNRSTGAFDAFFRSDYGLLYSVLSDLQTLESLHGLSQRRVRIELDALVTRLGGLQLHDRGRPRKNHARAPER